MSTIGNNGFFVAFLTFVI